MINQTIRTFFAIKLNDPCRQAIESIKADLRRQFPSHIKWVTVDNLHITVKFLGEFNLRDLPTLKNSLYLAFSKSHHFELIFRKLGVFPNEGYPKIIWIGIDPEPRINDIFLKIETAVGKLGYPSDPRGFSPHLTIGRVRNEANQSYRKVIADTVLNYHNKNICTCEVSEIFFLKSQLNPTGPTYSEIFSIKIF